MTYTTLPTKFAAAPPMPFSPGPVNATALHSGECCDGQRAAKPPALLMHGAVAQRAHDLYVKSGYRQGQSDENWLQAEADLRDRGTAACNTEHRILGVFAPDAGGDV